MRPEPHRVHFQTLFYCRSLETAAATLLRGFNEGETRSSSMKKRVSLGHAHTEIAWMEKCNYNLVAERESL